MEEHRLRRWVGNTIAARLSPERTRRATLLERMTVRRLSWDSVVRLNRILSAVGKVATCVWVAAIASIVIGLDWKTKVQALLNSGEPVDHIVVWAVLVPTVIFLATRSLIGFWRWRLQRELWRRDVERVTPGG